MSTITFNEVKLQAQKSGKCIVCGKRRRRSLIFRQTINPFNKKENGEVKRSEDIWPELYKDAAEWKQEPINCCEE